MILWFSIPVGYLLDNVNGSPFSKALALRGEALIQFVDRGAHLRVVLRAADGVDGGLLIRLLAVVNDPKGEQLLPSNMSTCPQS